MSRSATRQESLKVDSQPTHLHYMRGLEMHFAHDCTGYPCFYIHGMSGDQKRDEKALASHVRLFTAAPELLAAANEVLARYMPQFNDSRAVDDCLVQLAVAVTKAETGK